MRQFVRTLCSDRLSHVGPTEDSFPSFTSLKPFDLSFTRSQVTVDQYMISSTITNRLSCPMLLHSVSLQDASKGLTKVLYNSFTKSSRLLCLIVDSRHCSRSENWPTLSLFRGPFQRTSQSDHSSSISPPQATEKSD